MNDDSGALGGVAVAGDCVLDDPHVEDMLEPVTRIVDQLQHYSDFEGYEEWQILGIEDSDRGAQERDEENGEADSNPAIDALRDELVAEPTADDGDRDSKRGRFLSFMCNPHVETRVIWLNQTTFVMCAGPNSYTESDEGTLPWCLTESNIHGYFCFSAETEDGNLYSFIFNSIVAHRGEDDDEWSDDLLCLFSNSSRVKRVQFDGVSWDLLTAIVSRAPPPCGRTVEYQAFMLGEGTARILAFETHRDTELVLRLGDWFNRRPPCVPVLVEAMQSNRCPRRLVLQGTGTNSYERNEGQALADALQTTTGLDAITIELDSDWRGDWSHSNRLLEAIGRNDGIQNLAVVQQSQNMKPDRMVDIWNRILVSRTIERIDATQVHPAEEYTDEDRCTCALHVASMLRSNFVLTELLYDAGTHDKATMDRHAVPLLELNRLRLIVKSLTSSSKSDGGTERMLSLLLVGSTSRVRRTPWLLMYVVKTNREVFSKDNAASASMPSSPSHPRKRPAPA